MFIIEYTIKTFFMLLYVSYSNIKILNLSQNKKTKVFILLDIIATIVYACLCKILEMEINTTIFIEICVSIIYVILYKLKFLYSLLITIVSTAINQILFYIVAIILYFPIKLLNIEHEYQFIIVLLIQFILLILFWRIKRIHNGITFLKKWKDDEYINLMLLNISSGILFIAVIISNYQEGVTSKFGIMLIIFAIVMFITIWKSLQLYYRQQMLERTLKQTQEELNNKNKEIEKLEAEILEFNGISHSIDHKQKALMHKLEQLQMNNEVADEISLRKQIEDITKDLPDKKNIKLTKTGIEEVDDMLDYMQSECTQNKIEFQLQVIDSIFYMINHYINKDDLKILLADHIKDAIIAINHSDNINKSILVKIGKIAGIYGVYFYDSGIEFEIDTLVKLGNKPITTHKDEGGTGMGFVNTFKALSKSNASLEIEEIGKPTKDNYTKILKVEFDNKNEFRIKTYRKEEIKSKKIENKLIIQN